MKNAISESIKLWSKSPIGTSYSSLLVGSLEWFNDIANHRYSVYAPWMPKTFNFSQYSGKKVLEIGVGVGTDHTALAREGAILSGIDATLRSIELTRANLECHGFTSDLKLADAEYLPFADNTFDVVYSFGVLHHISSIERAVSEIKRVLKPGGELAIGLYHRHSFFYWIHVIGFPWRKKVEITRRLKAIEIGQENTGADIIVNVYSKKELRKIFSEFTALSIIVRHPTDTTTYIRDGLVKRTGRWVSVCIAFIFNHFIIPPTRAAKGNIFGWYIIIRAKK